MGATILATMRDEAPFLLEWIAYHKAIGFEKIIVFSNDCGDGTDKILSSLHRAGHLLHVPHDPDPNLTVVEQVGQRVLKDHLISDGDWMIWLDADEFLNIHVGKGSVNDLIAYVGDARGMCVSWRLFGDAGQNVFSGSFLAHPFTRCAPLGQRWQTVKTFFKFDSDITELYNHKPIFKPKFWENGGYFLSSSGSKLDTNNKYMQKWINGNKRSKIEDDEAGWNVAQINHYIVRTKPLFELKKQRGRIGKPNSLNSDRYSEKFFSSHNFNTSEDTSINRWINRTYEGMQFLQSSVLKELDVSALIQENYSTELVKPRTIDTDGRYSSAGTNVKTDTRIVENDFQRYQKMHRAHSKDHQQRSYANNRLAAEVQNLIKVQSVVDVGCGIGLLLQALKENDVEVLGLEGMWLDESQMVLAPDFYRLLDLERPFDLSSRFDVCFCIEVAEHLEPSRAESFVSDLCQLSDVVVFSAAIPGQGGHGHKNEQWQEYWCNLFGKNGYGTYDPFREKFRRDPDMLPWLQQNTILFLRHETNLSVKLADQEITPNLANFILPMYHKKALRRQKRRLSKGVE